MAYGQVLALESSAKNRIEKSWGDEFDFETIQIIKATLDTLTSYDGPELTRK